MAALMLVVMTLVFAGCVTGVSRARAARVTLALFCLFPLHAGMSHWFHSEQRNHWFGYWFGHDMFTPPFVGPDNQLTYDAKLRDAAAKGPTA